MKKFTLHLQSATQYETVLQVQSFTGIDKSGSFSLWAFHERFISCLEYGLSQFKAESSPVQYLASPGALVYFRDNELYFSCRRYFRDASFERIRELLDDQLKSEEKDLQKTRESIRQMENAMLKRLWQLSSGRE